MSWRRPARAFGADSAAPLGAHDSVAKLMTLAYGQALAEIESPPGDAADGS